MAERLLGGILHGSIALLGGTSRVPLRVGRFGLQEDSALMRYAQQGGAGLRIV